MGKNIKKITFLTFFLIEIVSAADNLSSDKKLFTVPEIISILERSYSAPLDASEISSHQIQRASSALQLPLPLPISFLPLPILENNSNAAEESSCTLRAFLETPPAASSLFLATLPSSANSLQAFSDCYFIPYAPSANSLRHNNLIPEASFSAPLPSLSGRGISISEASSPISQIISFESSNVLRSPTLSEHFSNAVLIGYSSMSSSPSISPIPTPRNFFGTGSNSFPNPPTPELLSDSSYSSSSSRSTSASSSGGAKKFSNSSLLNVFSNSADFLQIPVICQQPPIYNPVPTVPFAVSTPTNVPFSDPNHVLLPSSTSPFTVMPTQTQTEHSDLPNWICQTQRAEVANSSSDTEEILNKYSDNIVMANDFSHPEHPLFHPRKTSATTAVIDGVLSPDYMLTPTHVDQNPALRTDDTVPVSVSDVTTAQVVTSMGEERDEETDNHITANDEADKKAVAQDVFHMDVPTTGEKNTSGDEGAGI